MEREASGQSAIFSLLGHKGDLILVHFRRSFDELWDASQAVRGVTVLMTADHGQVDVAPDRVDYLDDLWPELPTLLSQRRPAGSSTTA